MLRFLLTARESHLCVNRPCAEKTRHPDCGASARGRCGSVSSQSFSRPWSPLIPPEVAPFYPAANTGKPMWHKALPV